MSERIHLRPCPFCGGKAHMVPLLQGKPEAETGSYIMCEDCGMRAANGEATCWGDNAAAWNRRVE